MRLSTGNETGETTRLGGANQSPAIPHCPAYEYENRTLSENRPSENQDHPAIVARATNDAVRDWNVKSGLLSWPQGLESLLGYEAAATKSEIGFWQKNVHSEDHARIAASIRDAIAANNQHWSGEYRFRRADGNYVHLLERALILRDGQGHAVRFVGSLMDITARKQLQDQLCRSQKMEAFGQLAGGVAHDFNNFLTTILGYSDLVIAETGVKGDVASHVAEIRKAAGRATNLTGQLLAFSRKQALEPRDIEVNSLIVNLERSVLRLLGDNVTVACHLHQEKEGVHIKVDPGQLTQIILNLAVNARDAMPHGGRLIFKTGTVTVSEDRQPIPGIDDLAPGDYVAIAVIDNGAGMSDEVKAHLFEPFFTTKDQGTGSGLGLATSYGIIRQSGGRIYVESELGKGTRVQIYFPKVSAPPVPSYKKPGSRNLPTGTGTVLVLA